MSRNTIFQQKIIDFQTHLNNIIDKFIETTYKKKEPDYFITKDKYTKKETINLKDIYFEIATFYDKERTNIRHIYRICFENL